MPVSPLTTTFIQSTVLNAISNILAQLIAQYGAKKSFNLHLLPLVQYLAYNTLVIPPNFYWQRYLEKRYPGSLRFSHLQTSAPVSGRQGDSGPIKEIKDKPLHLPQPVTHPRSGGWLSPGTKNFVAKFLLDQSVGSVGNILLFIVLINFLQGGGLGVIWAAVLEDFPHIMSARLMYRPVVSTLMYTLVPVDRRVVFGSACGVIWGVYLSLYAAV